MDGVLVGLDMFHFAVQLTDDSTGVTYDAVEPLDGAISVQVSPQVNSGTLFSDNGASDVATILSQFDITPVIRALPIATRAKILGHTIDDKGIMHVSIDDVAPYVAFGFRAEKNNGKHVYAWYHKGQFKPFQESYNTKTDQVQFQNPSLASTFIKRKYDGEMMTLADEDNATFTGGATWFDKVPGDTTPAV